MSRNFGFEPEVVPMYTVAELNQACNFNRIIGAFMGIAFTLLSEVGFVWYHGWF